MKPARAIVLIGIFVAGCDTAHNVVVSSYHAVTAPVRYVRRHIDSEPSSATTTTTTTSDVSTPGRPVTEPSPTPPSRIAARNSGSRDSSSTRRTTGNKSAAAKAKPSPAAPQFPVAKAVPGKPGLVFNPFDAKGGYIDVSGYASGSKVKDPESQKIFIVP
jgi:hypothetical protein